MFNLRRKKKQAAQETLKVTNHLISAYKCKEAIGYTGVHAAHSRYVEVHGGRPVQRKTIVRYCNNANGTGYVLPKKFVAFIQQLSLDLKV